MPSHHRPSRTWAVLSVLILVAAGAGPAVWAGGVSIEEVAEEVAEEAADAQENPLTPFEFFVGGSWHLGDSYQTVEWGIGRRWVEARSYSKTDGEPKLVSQGVWFHHPGEDRIEGYAVAIEMPVDFFEYTTTFDEGTMRSDLVTFGDGGGRETRYVEIWRPIDDDHYEWTLLNLDGDRVMGGTFERRHASPPDVEPGNPRGRNR